jgi:hypothetical protein
MVALYILFPIRFHGQLDLLPLVVGREEFDSWHGKGFVSVLPHIQSVVHGISL